MPRYGERRGTSALCASREPAANDQEEILDFAIVGAGPAGLALAIAMREKGLSVRVFEAASEVKERGAAVFLQVSFDLFSCVSWIWCDATVILTAFLFCS